MKILFRTNHILYFAIAVALVFVTGACSSHKSAQRDVPKIEAGTYIHGHKLSKTQKKLMEEACTWSGTPYQYGGADKGSGADCSGFVLRVFLDVADIKLPRNSAKQADFCKKVKAKDVRACDLVFFATGSDKKKVSHVGMMLDKESFIHATSSRGVTVTRIDHPWWGPRLLMYGRVPGV